LSIGRELGQEVGSPSEQGEDRPFAVNRHILDVLEPRQLRRMFSAQSTFALGLNMVGLAVNRPFCFHQQLAAWAETLNAAINAIGNVDVAIPPDCDTGRPGGGTMLDTCGWQPDPYLTRFAPIWQAEQPLRGEAVSQSNCGEHN
jgi:hypothetical protein